VLRLPGGSGAVLAYEPDSLQPIDWQASGPVPAAAVPLGLDLDQRVVYYLDTRQRLIGLDLEARIARSFVEGTTRATVGPDGAAYAVDSTGKLVRIARRAATTFPARFSATPNALFGTQNGQVVALSRDSGPALRLLSVEQSGDPIPLAGSLVAATYWGDLIAHATGRRLELIRPGDPSQNRRAELPRDARALAFSPSGHRVYALTATEVITFDRFSAERRGGISLPGQGAGLRVDPSGRWLLVQPESDDSVWIADLATSRLVLSAPTAWSGGLPAVAGAGTLLTSEGDDVLAWNLAAERPAPVARVLGGAADRWLPVAWVPPSRQATVQAATQSAQLAQDSAIRAGPAARSTVSEVYLQVSSSQNPDWADDLARQLSEAGHPAAVWTPAEPEESYRVVLGPYASRDEAEAAGRALGRPFFVVSGRPPRR